MPSVFAMTDRTDSDDRLVAVRFTQTLIFHLGGLSQTQYLCLNYPAPHQIMADFRKWRIDMDGNEAALVEKRHVPSPPGYTATARDLVRNGLLITSLLVWVGLRSCCPCRWPAPAGESL